MAVPPFHFELFLCAPWLVWAWKILHKQATVTEWLMGVAQKLKDVFAAIGSHLHRIMMLLVQPSLLRQMRSYVTVIIEMKMTNCRGKIHILKYISSDYSFSCGLIMAVYCVDANICTMTAIIESLKLTIILKKHQNTIEKVKIKEGKKRRGVYKKQLEVCL